MKITKQPRPIVVFVLTMVVFVGVLVAFDHVERAAIYRAGYFELGIPGRYLILSEDSTWRTVFIEPVLGSPRHGIFTSFPMIITPVRQILFIVFTLGLILTARAEFRAWRHRRFDHRQALLEQNPDF